MEFKQVSVPPFRVAMIRHTGPYESIGPVFDRLWGWVESRNVQVVRTLGLYYDNTEEVPANQLRSAAAVEVPLNYVLTDTAGLPITIETVTGGDYAMTTFVGPYEGLSPIWAQLVDYAERKLKRNVSQNPAYEVYVNDPEETPADRLITELYLPLE
ncbi:MAG: GyrI-like domain-containing protein [Armatimonadetes bacterium]|nr:GyrI-like domain-containing protein [Armatimonadota bacterium]